ncbi:ABC transporter permease [Methanooceanicella nereidis]|nr:ABC transporter permease [Methanocella sp. CWC-04]
MSKIITEIKYCMIQFFRNKGAVFFVFVMPVIFLVLIGYLFGGQAVSRTLYYNDCDVSMTSGSIINALNATGAFELYDGSGMDLAQLLKDGKISAYIEIPYGFEKNMAAVKSSENSDNVIMNLYYDGSKQTSMPVVSVVRQSIDQANMDMAGTSELAAISVHEAGGSSNSYMGFLVTGIIGMCIMSGAINLAAGTISGYRATGVFRKLATTPLSRIEWNISRTIAWSFIILLSVAISLLIALILYRVLPAFNILSMLLMISGSIMFTELGMIMAYVFKEGGSAQTIAFTITLPLMFISGSLFPIGNLPGFLQLVAAVSPLTYLNNGLRSSMITGNFGDAFTDLVIVGALGIVFFCIGVVLLKWKED